MTEASLHGSSVLVIEAVRSDGLHPWAPTVGKLALVDREGIAQAQLGLWAMCWERRACQRLELRFGPPLEMDGVPA